MNSIIASLSRYIDNLSTIEPGILSTISPSARGFLPGAHTADRGTLGDSSGRLEITPESGFGPATAARYELSAPLSAVATTYDVTVTSDPAGTAIVYAGQPGIASLEFVALENGKPDTELGHVLLSVPWFFTVELTTEFHTALEAQVGANEVTSVLERTRTVMNHILRPGNVRVLWPILGDTLPL